MIARELIAEDIPLLKTSDTGKVAMLWMNEFHVKHLPIVNNQRLLGVISEDDVLSVENVEEPIGNYRLSFIRPFVDQEDHILNVLKVLGELRLTTVPVVDGEENYLGAISLDSILQHFSALAALTEPGAIVSLEMSVRDYSLTEIARIVEATDTRILSLFTSPHTDSSKLEVTLKFNRTDVAGLMASFERFGYKAVAYQHEQQHEAFFKDRYDALMNYLNM
jgi:signal-transduction protein with cAMP-binding, CBS, and nucleotidyltransferase domain